MKNLIYLVAIIAFAITGCKKDNITGDGPVETQQRNLRDFTAVSVSGASQTFITRGNEFGVSIKAYSTLLPYLESRVVNGTLKIYYKSGTRVRNDNSVITITMPYLSGITSEGSGNVSATGDFDGQDSFHIKVSGSSDISVQSGSAKTFDSEIEGSGNIRAFGFSAESAKVKISGSGNTEIAVSKMLDAKISGSGNVYYKGDPAQINTNISGSGKVIRQ